MQRVFSRTLVNYSKVNGTKFTLAPDLATDLGTHNADYTEWTYTLKSGLKYSDGTAITPQDIKYAVERMLRDRRHHRRPRLLLHRASSTRPASLQGPVQERRPARLGHRGRRPRQITFHLKKPFADFNYLLALPTSAPVPKAKDTGANYTKAPGLLRSVRDLSPTRRQKSVTFTRNKYW